MNGTNTWLPSALQHAQKSEFYFFFPTSTSLHGIFQLLYSYLKLVPVDEFPLKKSLNGIPKLSVRHDVGERVCL